jgi:hypothetical protein
MGTRGVTAPESGQRTDGRTPVLVVAALASFLLSPITAVWAVALGFAMSAVGLLVLRTGSSGRRPLLLSAGIGVVLGTLPYFLLALLQA